MGAIDTLFEIGVSFDWLTPLWALVQDVINGPSHTFFVPADSGYSGREITRLLHRHGVKTWGVMIVNQTLMITVRQRQARWADYLLQRAGIPLQNPLTNGPQLAGAGQLHPKAAEPKPAGGLSGFIAELDRFIDL